MNPSPLDAQEHLKDQFDILGIIFIHFLPEGLDEKILMSVWWTQKMAKML